ncbi:MAG: biotin-dependent carboxyltransferase [Proteobacteria bacterium]|nr:biotin-dependent carboxyltransferase [Pseudomonadota bacterium]
MISVMKSGLQTSVQDYPGRIGHMSLGFPPSGPFDSWSFRLANLLVGNPGTAAGIECQFLGPTLRFEAPAVFAVCGADMSAKLDGVPLERWRSLEAKAGQVLEFGAAKTGARTYIAVSGGLDVPVFLGARATFQKASVGGVGGRALKPGDRIAMLPASSDARAGREVRAEARPPLDGVRRWTVDVVAGPHDDWLAPEAIAMFLSSPWKLSGKSDRTGFRLEGPPFAFAAKATDKPPENGSDPSNIIDFGYPIGGINLAGQTPIILVSDALTMGGFICPFTVPTSSFWQLAQSRPGDLYDFNLLSVGDAQTARQRLDALCTVDSLL